jgi:hypothetical protein
LPDRKSIPWDAPAILSGGIYVPESKPTTLREADDHPVWMNLGGDPAQSGSTQNGGDQDFEYPICMACALDGDHGEFSEEGGYNNSRNDKYVQLIWLGGSIHYDGSTKQDLTAPGYISAGAQNGLIYNTAQYIDGFTINNPINCSNLPPYGPSNHCAGQFGGGGGWFVTNYTTEIGTLTVGGNVLDDENGGYCWRNQLNAVTNANNTVSVSGGNVLTVAFAASGTNFSLPVLQWFWPGMWLEDGNAGDNFIPTRMLGGLSGPNGGTENTLGTMQGIFNSAGAPSGAGHTVFISTGPQNFIVGESVLGADSFGYSTRSAGAIDLVIDSTHAELVGSFSNFPALGQVIVVNSTNTAQPQGTSNVPGGNPGVGTILLANNSEPNIANSTNWITAAAVDSVLDNGEPSYRFVGSGSNVRVYYSKIDGFQTNGVQQCQATP